MAARPRWRPPSRPVQLLIRDWISYAVGILGIIFEATTEQTDRPTLLLLFGAMIGLPLYLNSTRPDPPPPPPPPPPLPPPVPPTPEA